MSTRGIPAQVKALTERVEAVEVSQQTCQQVIDDEVLPVVAELTKRVESLSEELDRMRRGRK